MSAVRLMMQLLDKRGFQSNHLPVLAVRHFFINLKVAGPEACEILLLLHLAFGEYGIQNTFFVGI